MTEDITRESLSFASADGTSTVAAFAWHPAGTPVGIVQITHGMAEHVLRYDEFARFLAAHGYLVVGHDQIGHGATAAPERRGCLPAKTGKDLLLADVDKLREIAHGLAPTGTLHFLFGHSLGSYITRCYVARRGEGLAGAVICGTGTVPVGTSKAGNAVARLICRVRGEDYQSKLLDNMGVGAYAKQIENAETNLDWLSFNRENVRRYQADELCGFMFSAGGYATVTSLTAEACDVATAAKVPAGLPLLFVAGEGDPVGSMGEGVRAAVQLAKTAGSNDVSCIIYQGMRHEILNEDGRGQVMQDILDWLEDKR